MEDKNTHRRNLTIEFIATIGWGIVRIPLLLVTICVIVIVIFLLLTGAFIDPSASREYGYNLNNLAGLIVATTCLWAALHKTRREIIKLYSLITRYRTMQQEKARIEKLMAHDNIQSSSEADLVYAQDSALQKEMKH
jgi:hypothetical protein